jgi:uncharacterized protein
MTTTEAGRDAAVAPPIPEPDDLTRFFWDGVKAHTLLIQRCNRCRHYIHPPREVCRFCLSIDLSPQEVSGRGVLETFTIPLQPFNAWFLAHLPYILAVVELEEQEDLKVVTNIVDCTEEELRCGAAVHVVYREVYPDLTLPLFVLDTVAGDGATGSVQ